MRNDFFNLKFMGEPGFGAGDVPPFGVPEVGQSDPALSKEQAARRIAIKRLMNADSHNLYDTILIDLELAPVTGVLPYLNLVWPVQEYEFFKNGVGAEADGWTRKTLCQTNVQRNGGIPKGERWMITDIGFNAYFILNQNSPYWFIAPAAAEAYFDFESYQKCLQLCSMWVLGSAFIEAHLEYRKQQITRQLGKPVFYPSGHNFKDEVGNGFATFPQIISRRKLDTPLLLESNDNFSIAYKRCEPLDENIPVIYEQNADHPAVAEKIDCYIAIEITLFGKHDVGLVQ
ncbi:hypothetical protein JW935_05960 [candidate division KSB1 bacterium]|nr:hypothetical protein [candidate division KSB1 bacterium]